MNMRREIRQGLLGLVRRLSILAPGGRGFDPRQVGDPLAERTGWDPVKPGGASFCTRRLVERGADRVEFRVTAGALAFYLVFLLLGIGVVAGVGVGAIVRRAFEWPLLVPLIVGTVFAAVGGGMLRVGTAPVVFDRRRGYFWKGRLAPDEVFDKSRVKNAARLEDIHALQIISEYCRGDKSSYYSYELNLVLGDGGRLNVVDHGNLRKLREDAQRLARFLGKPLWDAA